MPLNSWNHQEVFVTPLPDEEHKLIQPPYQGTHRKRDTVSWSRYAMILLCGLGLIASITYVSLYGGSGVPTTVDRPSPLSTERSEIPSTVPTTVPATQGPPTPLEASLVDSASGWSITETREMSDGLLGFLIGLRQRGIPLVTTNDEQIISLGVRSCQPGFTDRDVQILWWVSFPNLTAEQIVNVKVWVQNHCPMKPGD